MSHQITLLQAIKESNLLNFAVFLGAIVWMLQKHLPSLTNQKNAELESALRQAKERCRLAEEQLSVAERELRSFKDNLEQMKADSESRISSLKADLEAEKERAINNLKNKYERDLESLKVNMRKQIKGQLSRMALDLAEQMLRENKDLKRFDELSFAQTVKMIETQPELLKN